MAGNTLKFKAVLDDKVSSSLAKIRDNFDRLGKNKGAQSVLAGVGLGAGISAYQTLQRAVSGVIDTTFDSIAAASAMAETLSKSRAVFGDSSAGIEAWAETAAEAFGQSTQQALE